MATSAGYSDAIRAIALRTEFVDVKVCAVDRDWSALKFLRRRGQPGAQERRPVVR